MAVLQLKPERLDAGEFDEQPVSICGKAFIADVSGALYWPAEDALVIADLHLEKGSSYARKGVMLPPYDTRETLSRLAVALDRYDASTVIALGDNLHDTGGGERLSAEDRETLRLIQEDREWIWITGNHDAALAEQAAIDHCGGRVRIEAEVDGLLLRHEAEPGELRPELSGHFHPKLRIRARGRAVARRCFVASGTKLILPAFGALTGGLDVDHPEIVRAVGRGAQALVALEDRLLRFPIAA